MNLLKAENRKSSESVESTGALLSEIDRLRQQLAGAEARNDIIKERLKHFASALKLGFWEWDEIDDVAVSYSPGMAQIFDLDLEQFTDMFRRHQDFHAYIHPQDLDYFIEQTTAVSNLGDRLKQGHVFDYRILLGSGEVRSLRETRFGQYSESGQLVASFGMLQDVSEYHNAVAALTETEKRFSSLIENLPLGILEEDYSALKKSIDGIDLQDFAGIEDYLMANPEFVRELAGQTNITNVNAALISIHQADSVEQFIAAEADVDDWWNEHWVGFYAAEIGVLANNRAYEAERFDTRMDDSPFHTRTITTVVRGYEETWERVITIHEDITQRKKFEADMIEAKALAEKANQAKSEFISSMSHELRTPLNAILGFSQLFEYDRSLSKEQLLNATEINHAGKHLMSLIDQILDLSKIEAGEVDLSLEPVSLAHVLDDSVTWVTPLAQKRDITIEFDIAQFQKMNVTADTIRLKQVFLNLLTNAIKYNRQGGRVRIKYERALDGYVRIGVEDTGTGITEEKRKELFQPFNRLGAEFSSVEGTGIGLIITRQLVDLMNGRLDIDSTPDVGSTFWVSLKSLSVPNVIGEPGVSDRNLFDATNFRNTGSRILVAEDNQVNRDLMVAQLNVLGFQSNYAEDGAKALDLWREGKYDVLLTDIRMPEMNGYELVREIRMLEQGQQQRSAVIAITANALEADVKKCLEAGIDDVISKPVELEDLRDVLEKWAPGMVAEKKVDDDPGKLDTPPDQPVDMGVLRQSTGDNLELHRQLLRTFADSLSECSDEIEQAFAWKNHEQIAEYAHKLKSSSRSMGAVLLGDICQQMEDVSRLGKWTEIEKLQPQLMRYKDEVKVFIDDFLEDSLSTRPAKRKSEALRQVTAEDDDITEFSIRLLLVDDDYVMHRITTVMLNDLGISRVQSAMSAPAALEILQQEGAQVDVVICDLNMPDMDGVEFIRHLARQDYTGAIILTSGEDLRILKTVEKLAIEHDLHVLGVLEKPITPAKLGELLDSLDQIRAEGTMLMTDFFTVAELENAIKSDQLDTFFQPKVEIKSGKVVGVEALVRWHHPQLGLIKPNSFISMAEDNGLIGDLTDVVCRKALEYAAQLKTHGHDLNVAINISVDALTNLEWPDKTSDLVRQSGLDASDISFEITESRLMDHLSVALDILSRLSLKRFKLSIDDFGTGYSSLEQLQRIPFTEFKIDRAFVHGAAREASARAILESSVLLAKKLDMVVVAEGVENQEDWDLVSEVGCDLVQGYFISRPLPFKQLLSWLDNWKQF